MSKWQLDDWPIDHPKLREWFLVEDWHAIRVAWGAALDEVTQEAERLLALPVSDC